MNMSSLVQGPLKAVLLAVCVFAGVAIPQHHQPGRFAGMPAPTSPALIPRAFAPPGVASPALIKRAGDACDNDRHPCNDLQIEGLQACCKNTEYCFLDSDWTPKCCTLGSSCNQTCGPNSLLCNVTVATTLSGSVSSGSLTVTTTGSASVVTESGTGCCPRPCSESTQFLCASSLGGGCCRFGQVCATSKSCIWTDSPTSTTSNQPSLTLVPEGCSAVTQFSCPASLGGGCCNNGETCTVVNASPYCKPNSTSSGLSSGAKAGIGAGAAIGGGVVVALSTWAFLAWRHRRKEHALEGREIGDGVGGGAVGSGYDDDEDAGTHGTRTHNSRRPGRSRGHTASDVLTNGTTPYQNQGNEYFGPDAVSGPFTYSDDNPTHPDGLGPWLAVPAGVPHGPGDIAAPVEIDSKTKQEDEQVERHPVTRVRVVSVDQSAPVEIYTDYPHPGAVEMVNVPPRPESQALPRGSHVNPLTGLPASSSAGESPGSEMPEPSPPVGSPTMGGLPEPGSTEQAGRASTSPLPSPGIDAPHVQRPVSPTSPQPRGAEPSSSAEGAK